MWLEDLLEEENKRIPEKEGVRAEVVMRSSEELLEMGLGSSSWIRGQGEEGQLWG